MGLDGRVSFTGKVPNDALPEILSRHDVYLSASLWDGTSLSLLEAMATGLFPVVSDIKANSAWLNHKADGLLHKVGDAQDLANCIMQLCSNPALAAEAAGRNREKVLRSASRKANMKHLEQIYEKLVRRRG